MSPPAPIALLDPDPASPFPDPRRALRRPDGLLAVGGDLSPERLIKAYRQGIFPWYSEGEPILWWSPDPRCVFATDDIHLGRRFRRQLRASPWILRADTAFDAVIQACAAMPRAGQSGTWITTEMVEAYRRLHRLGEAHSIEVYEGERLVGGLYGVAVGRMFCGESMFSLQPGASKAALAGLAAWLRALGWPWLDAQVENAHTRSLGARPMSRDDYLAVLARLRDLPGLSGSWSESFGIRPARELV